MLKCGNQRVFRKDLEHHLADLNHTLGERERAFLTFSSPYVGIFVDVALAVHI